MPTIISHALVPLTVASVAGRQRIPQKVMLAGALLAMLPDADVVGFRLGVDYGDAWGHRGATHALAFAALASGVLAFLVPAARKVPALLFLFAAGASHGLLDALTDGGRGVALWWPLTDQRFFAPLRPIHVSPIGAGFFSARGLVTLWSEIRWIWLPCLTLAGLAAGQRARARGGTVLPPAG